MMKHNQYTELSKEEIQKQEKILVDRQNKWLRLLKEVPQEDQALWVYKSLKNKKNLYIFGRYFFPHIIKSNIEYGHYLLLQELSSPETSGIIFPRGHAKTTWEKIDTIHDIVYGLETVIVYISDVLKSASFHFESIKQELESNQYLIAVYGDLVPPMKQRESTKWTNTHFETLNGVNVIARGAGKGRGVNIKNNRPTKVILDDIETDEQVKNPILRQKLRDWVYGVVFPSLDPVRGRAKWVGTLLHDEAELLKFYKKFGGLFLPATYDGKLTDESMPIFNAVFTVDKLKNEKDKIGTRTFNQEYMHQPSSSEIAAIKPEWIDGNTFISMPESREKRNVIIAMDPQGGESLQADEYAITVLCWYNKDPHRYILEQKTGRGSQMAQAKELIKTWQEYPEATSVSIEKILNQVTIYQLVLSWKNFDLELDGIDGTNRNIPIKSYQPRGKTGGKFKSKLDRFKQHEPLIERGELHLRPEMTELRDQLVFFGLDVVDHDDRADSVLMALDQSYTMRHIDNDDGIGMGGRSEIGNLWKEQF